MEKGRKKKILAVLLVLILAVNLPTAEFWAAGLPELIESTQDASSSEELSLAAEQERNTSEEELGYVPGEIILLYDSDTMDSDELEEAADEQGGTITEQVELSGDDSVAVAVVEISDDQTVEKALEEYAEEEGVVSAQPNYILYLYDAEEDATVDESVPEESSAEDEMDSETSAAESSAAEESTSESSAENSWEQGDTSAPSTEESSAEESGSENSEEGSTAETTAEETSAEETTEDVTEESTEESSDSGDSEELQITDTNDPQRSSQWYLDVIGLDDAWEIMAETDGEAVTVAVIDSGAEYLHEDLASIINLETSVEITEEGITSLTGDSDGHGTHVAGILAAEADNGLGIAGVASTSTNDVVDLMIVDVFDGSTTTTVQAILGINYAVEQGASIINMSFGSVVGESDSSSDNQALKAACQAAYDAGVTLICSAGNNSTDDYCIPADYDTTISVISVNASYTKTESSNYGSAKDLSAPGSRILSTYSGDSYVYLSGTSMAAPMVSAAAAMMLKVNPDLTPDQIRELLCSTATDIGDTGEDVLTGAGLLNVGAAVEAAEQYVAEAEPEAEEVSVTYSTHVQTYGWMDEVSDGEISGTTNLAKRMEAIQITVSGDADLGVTYRTYLQTYGWGDYVSDGEISGTVGLAKRMEAIQIELTGEDADNYDIYYRVHSQTYGWLGWAKNGETAGTSRYSKRIEAIQIVIVPKGSEAPGDTEDHYIRPALLSYRVHAQTYGWMTAVSDGEMAGTTGVAKRLEAIRISLNQADFDGSIRYRAHVQTYGWESSWNYDGALSGTTGLYKRLEAIQIELTGEMAEEYDIYYRVHVQTYGWLGWAKNGESAGTAGYAKRLEAIEIVLVEKGGEAPGSTENCYMEK